MYSMWFMGNQKWECNGCAVWILPSQWCKMLLSSTSQWSIIICLKKLSMALNYTTGGVKQWSERQAAVHDAILGSSRIARDKFGGCMCSTKHASTSFCGTWKCTKLHAMGSSLTQTGPTIMFYVCMHRHW